MILKLLWGRTVSDRILVALVTIGALAVPASSTRSVLLALLISTLLLGILGAFLVWEYRRARSQPFGQLYVRTRDDVLSLCMQGREVLQLTLNCGLEWQDLQPPDRRALARLLQGDKRTPYKAVDITTGQVLGVYDINGYEWTDIPAYYQQLTEEL